MTAREVEAELAELRVQRDAAVTRARWAERSQRRLIRLLGLAIRGCLGPGGIDAFCAFVVALAAWRDSAAFRAAHQEVHDGE
jgi:hypothetical protein